MNDIEFTTSTGRMLMIWALFLLLGSIALITGDGTIKDVFTIMSTVTASFVIIFLLKVD